MVFENIFDLAKSASSSARSTQTGIVGYLPASPTEAATVAPHDPAQPAPDTWVRDPKIVRESAPELADLFGFVSSVSEALTSAADKQGPVANDPTSTTGAAESIMGQGQEATRKATDDLPQPTINHPSPPPKVDTPHPDGA